MWTCTGYGNMREVIFAMVYVSFEMVVAEIWCNITALVLKATKTEPRIKSVLKILDKTKPGKAFLCAA